MSDLDETVVVPCEGCRQTRVMPTVAAYDHDVDYLTTTGLYDSTTYFLRIVKCPVCNTAHLVLLDDGEIQVLWPSKKSSVKGLPEKVSKAYRAAQNVKGVDANAFGVLVGRVLEIVCQEQGVTGHSLQQKLRALASEGIIPAQLAEMTDHMRQLRNIGAHAELGELTQDDIRILDSLCEAVLEYVYSAPLLLREVEQRIKAHKLVQT